MILPKEETKPVPLSKRRWFKPTLFGLAIVFGVSLFFYFTLRLIDFIGDNYDMSFPKMIEVKINPPVVFTKRVIEIQPVATPTATPTATPSAIPKNTSLKKERVYDYSKYGKKPFYDKIIAGVQANFTNWEDAAQLISHEGMFDPSIKNPTSGACGLFQALPCSKMKCPLDESGIDCQIAWGKQYVADRYGTVSNALTFRLNEGWY